MSSGSGRGLAAVELRQQTRAPAVWLRQRSKLRQRTRSGSGRELRQRMQAPAAGALQQRASSGSGCKLQQCRSSSVASSGGVRAPAAVKLRQQARSGSGRELRQRCSCGGVFCLPCAVGRGRSLRSARCCRARTESSVCKALSSTGLQAAVERGSARRCQVRVCQALLSAGPLAACVLRQRVSSGSR